MADKNFKVKNGFEIEIGTISINSSGQWFGGTQVANSSTFFLANSTLFANSSLFANSANYATVALMANNADFLGNTQSTFYVKNTDSRVLSGNLEFSGVNVTFTEGIKVGSEYFINTTSAFLANLDVGMLDCGIYCNTTHLKISALSNPVLIGNTEQTTLYANGGVKFLTNSSIVQIKTATGNVVTANDTSLTLMAGNTFVNQSNGTTTTLYGANAAAIIANSTSTIINKFSMGSAVREYINVQSISTNGTFSYYITQQAATYHTVNAAGNWIINVAANSTTTLNSYMAVGDSLSIVFIAAIGATGYYNTALHIDGANQTLRWLSGWVPTYGYTNTVSIYSYTIIKTAASTYTTLAAMHPYGV